MSVDKPKESRIPKAGDDSFWEKFTAPIAAFLDDWRSKEDLEAWATERKMSDDLLRNGLAWLYMNHRARYHLPSQKWGPMDGPIPKGFIDRKASAGDEEARERPGGRPQT